MKYYVISKDKDFFDTKKVHFLLKDNFWCKGIPLEYVERLIKYSLCFGVYIKDTRELVGFGRVISDFTTYAYVCDIVITPKHRRKGLATTLLNAMMRHKDLQGLKVWSLRSTDMSKTIYERAGFKKLRNIKSALEIENLNIYTDPKFINLYISENI